MKMKRKDSEKGYIPCEKISNKDDLVNDSWQRIKNKSAICDNFDGCEEKGSFPSVCYSLCRKKEKLLEQRKFI